MLLVSSVRPSAANLPFFPSSPPPPPPPPSWADGSCALAHLLPFGLHRTAPAEQRTQNTEQRLGTREEQRLSEHITNISPPRQPKASVDACREYCTSTRTSTVPLVLYRYEYSTVPYCTAASSLRISPVAGEGEHSTVLYGSIERLNSRTGFQYRPSYSVCFTAHITQLAAYFAQCEDYQHQPVIRQSQSSPPAIRPFILLHMGISKPVRVPYIKCHLPLRTRTNTIRPFGGSTGGHLK